ncbi:MAG: type II toxin-antitoxin system RelE/ParE family toxin [Coriobacteriia bacterium]|nr:type II toxin-antitoxin system RelE/ParE family toxin [Coriobacteriia bacterium]
MRVRFTPQADQQYLDALRFIRAKSRAGAASVQRRAEAVIEQLGKHPDSGHVIPEFPELPHRELPVPPYRFFHRVVGETPSGLSRSGIRASSPTNRTILGVAN